MKNIKKITNEEEAIKELTLTFPDFLDSEFFFDENLAFYNSLMHDFGNYVVQQIYQKKEYVLSRIALYINLIILSDLKSKDKFLEEAVSNGIFEPHGEKIKESKLYELLSEDSKNILDLCIKK